MLEDGTVGEVFAFFADEMPIAVNEVIGLTVAGAGAFYRRCVQADVELPDGQHPQPKAAARTLDIIATLPQRWRTRALCDVLPRGHLVGLAAALDLAKDLGEVSQIAAWRTWPRISPIRYWSNAGLRSSLPSICHGGICWSTRARLSPICHRSAADKAGAVSRSLQPALMSAP